MKGILGFLGHVNKAWVGGVVSFIAVFVVQQFFGLTLETGTTDLITNILWQALVALGVAAPTSALVYAVPNKPTVDSVVKDAAKVGLAAIPNAGFPPRPGTPLYGDTDFGSKV